MLRCPSTVQEKIHVTPRKVLIVDDEPYIREVAQISLETTTVNWTILTAGSGLQALDLAASENPDVILLDVMMPGMDGLTTFHKLQENSMTKDIPVIFLTAKTQFREQNIDTQNGTLDTILKPFSPLDLADKISTILDW